MDARYSLRMTTYYGLLGQPRYIVVLVDLRLNRTVAECAIPRDDWPLQEWADRMIRVYERSPDSAVGV